jgi:hypothetical protein
MGEGRIDLELNISHAKRQLDKLKTETELEYSRKIQKFDEELRAQRDALELEIAAERKAFDLELNSLPEVIKWRDNPDNRLVSVKEAREMIDQAMLRVMDEVKRLYGG